MFEKLILPFQQEDFSHLFCEPHSQSPTSWPLLTQSQNSSEGARHFHVWSIKTVQTQWALPLCPNSLSCWILTRQKMRYLMEVQVRMQHWTITAPLSTNSEKLCFSSGLLQTLFVMALNGCLQCHGRTMLFSLLPRNNTLCQTWGERREDSKKPQYKVQSWVSVRVPDLVFIMWLHNLNSQKQWCH